MDNLTIVKDLLDNYLSINYTELYSVDKEDLYRLKNDVEILELIKKYLKIWRNSDGLHIEFGSVKKDDKQGKYFIWPSDYGITNNLVYNDEEYIDFLKILGWLIDNNKTINSDYEI